MTGRLKLVLSLIVILIIFISYQALNLYFARIPVRSSQSLLTQYDKIKNHYPQQAQLALQLILDKNPNHAIALRELGLSYLKAGDSQKAYHYLQRALASNPSDEIAARYVNILQPAPRLHTVQKSVTNPSIKLTIYSGLDLLRQIRSNYSPIINAPQVLPPLLPTLNQHRAQREIKSNRRTTLLNTFYQAKKFNQKQALVVAKKLLHHFPNDPVILKEIGYFALNQNKDDLAIACFRRAYQLRPEKKLALQMAYILYKQGEEQQAYRYFKIASTSKQLARRYQAEIALTNMKGSNLKLIPKPFFAEAYYDPFYSSRFHLFVKPLVLRLGAVVNEHYHLQTYFSYRRNTDNKSGTIAGLPQIYADNVAIYALGMQLTPCPKLPLFAFAEIGRAKDLLNQNRARWRGDVRYGLAYFQDWGHAARFKFTPTFSLKGVADIYADLIYYSRYHNAIASLRARPGLEIFRWQTSAVELYLRTFLMKDTAHLFYNNIAEIGPGVAIIPSDRYNIALRYEYVQGYYLKQNDYNPYGKTYHNQLWQLNFFVRL